MVKASEDGGSRDAEERRREERRFRGNGVLGPRERAELNRDLGLASRRIHGQKHDGQER
jgi:hypothetical protein